MPYHADVIGSLLRPHYLVQARAALAAGQMSMEEFKRIEDRAVDQAIAMQEGCGLDVINDGELRRFSFLDHLLGDMEGVADMPGAPVHFHAADPAQDWDWHPPFTVTGRIRPKGPMMTIEEFSYARGRARVPVKITMPSPLVMYGAWSPELSRPAYSDPFELFADAADVIRAEAARAGPARLHLHPDRLARPRHAGGPGEPRAARGPGHGHRAHAHRGRRHHQLSGRRARSDVRPAHMQGQLREQVDRDRRLRVHRGQGVQPGGQLRRVPARVRRRAVGLVRAAGQRAGRQGGRARSGVEQAPRARAADALIARIDEAARYVGRERLALSTQCGFSPVSIGGNLISEDTQQRKLELVAEVAHQVW